EFCRPFVILIASVDFAFAKQQLAPIQDGRLGVKFALSRNMLQVTRISLLCPLAENAAFVQQPKSCSTFSQKHRCQNDCDPFFHGCSPRVVQNRSDSLRFKSMANS